MQNNSLVRTNTSQKLRISWKDLGKKVSSRGIDNSFILIILPHTPYLILISIPSPQTSPRISPQPRAADSSHHGSTSLSNRTQCSGCSTTSASSTGFPILPPHPRQREGRTNPHLPTLAICRPTSPPYPRSEGPHCTRCFRGHGEEASQCEMFGPETLGCGYKDVWQLRMDVLR